MTIGLGVILTAEAGTWNQIGTPPAEVSIRWTVKRD